MKTLKYLTKAHVWITALFVTLNILAGNTSYAQGTTVPEQVDVNINADSGGGWYAQPWVWVVGVALFIIIIIAITRSGSREV